MLSIIVAVDSTDGIGKDNDLLCKISEDLKRFKRLTKNKKIIMGRKTFESLPFILNNRTHIVLTNAIAAKQSFKSNRYSKPVEIKLLAPNFYTSENIIDYTSMIKTPYKHSENPFLGFTFDSNYICTRCFSPINNESEINDYVICKKCDSEYYITLRNNLDELILKYKDTDEEVFIIGGSQIYSQTIRYCKKIYMTNIDYNFEADVFFPKFKKDKYELVAQSDYYTDAKTGLKFMYSDYSKLY